MQNQNLLRLFFSESGFINGKRTFRKMLGKPFASKFTILLSLAYKWSLSCFLHGAAVGLLQDLGNQSGDFLLPSTTQH